MAHDKVQFEPHNEFYKFEGGMKKMCIAFIALGVLGAIWAFFDNHGMNLHSRFWSNLLLNTYYFNGMAIAAIFFVSAHTIGYGGWFIVVKRVIESFGNFVYVSIPLFLIITIGTWRDWHNLYFHWTHPEAGDTIVGDKEAFLNPLTFTLLSCLFFALWTIGIRMIRKHSLSSDHAPDEYAYNQKSKYIAAFYIVVFGVSTSVFSWLSVMSLDPHWYSTMFGWYNFASYMCGFLAMAILVITYLKYKGHLSFVNDSHMHNIVLFLFGFSVFWTYVWFDQFMLQWYANIPEDTMWFYKRFNVPLFKFIFLATFVINFAFPFLFLIKRKAKRNPWIYCIAAGILIVGHWLDFYLMVMYEPNAPMHHAAEAGKASHHSQANTLLDSKLLAQNTSHSVEGHANATIESVNTISAELAHTKDSVTHKDVMPTEAHTSEEAHISSASHSVDAVTHEANAEGAIHHEAEHKAEHIATLGLPEIMMLLGFIGLFFFTVFSTLTKDRLVPIKSPFLDESLNYKW